MYVSYVPVQTEGMKEGGQALHEHEDGQREEGPHREDHVQHDGVDGGTPAQAHA